MPLTSATTHVTTLPNLYPQHNTDATHRTHFWFPGYDFGFFWGQLVLWGVSRDLLKAFRFSTFTGKEYRQYLCHHQSTAHRSTTPGTRMLDRFGCSSVEMFINDEKLKSWKLKCWKCCNLEELKVENTGHVEMLRKSHHSEKEMHITFQHFKFRHVSISTFFNFQLSNCFHISNIVIFNISFSHIGCYSNFQHFSFTLYTCIHVIVCTQLWLKFQASENNIA